MAESAHLPPLRERRGDIPLLVGHFIDIFNKKLNKSLEGLSSEAMALLMRHDWSGNIRELENVIERAIILAKDSLITPSELPPSIITGDTIGSSIEEGQTLSIKKATRRIEEELIKKVLQITDGNKSKASKILEISRPILIAKIKEFGIS